MSESPRVLALDALRMADLPQVGGKNASLGEMIGQLADQGVRVPGGFATTAHAFREFLDAAGLPERIRDALAGLEVDDVNELARVGAQIRGWIEAAPLPDALIRRGARPLTTRSPADGEAATVAVRSSATAEDLPDASFAGQQETFLNINGIESVLQAIKEGICVALQRSRHRLSRPPGLRARRRRALRRESSEWFAATSAPPA